MLRSQLSLVRSFSTVLGSGLVVNASTFAIMALAPITLSVQDFAKLALSVTGVMFLATLMDLGLSVTSIRQFAATKNPAYVALSIKFRVLLFLIISPLAITLCFWPELRPYAVALIGAASLNIWTGLRAADQAREEFTGLAKANLTFSVTRLVFAGAGLASHSWIGVLIGMFPAPVLIIAAYKAKDLLRNIRADTTPVLSSSVVYARYVFLSAVCYNGLMALPTAIAGVKLDPIALGTIGLANTLIAPVALLNAAARLVLMPRVSANGMSLRSILSPTKVIMGLALTLLFATTAGLLGAFFYSEKFPMSGPVISIMTAGLIVTSILGLMNLEIHRIGAPSLEAIANLMRLIVTTSILWFLAESVFVLSLTSAACMVAGEIALFLMIKIRSGKIKSI